MSENLRDQCEAKISDAYYEARNNGETMTVAAKNAADAVLAVVGPELDRLRAEVERSRSALRTTGLALAAERERLAKVHEVVDGKAGGFAQAVRAALASVPEPSDSESEPHRDAQGGLNVAPRSPRSPEGVSGAQRGTQRFEPDADREAGERCTCGAPDAYALTPGETIVHRRDGEPCYIAQSADGAS